MNLLKGVKLWHLQAPIGASSSIATFSGRADMSAFDGLLVIVPVTDSAASGVATITLKESAADSTVGAATITGGVATATCVVNDDLNSHLLAVDVYKPMKRYVGIYLQSATANIAYGDTIAIAYKGKKKPVTQLTAEVLASTQVVGS